MKINPIATFKELVGSSIDDRDFFAELEIQNKDKVWEFNPIKVSVEKGKFIHNAEEVKLAVTDLVVFADKKIENAESVDDVEALKKQTSIIQSWLQGTRTQMTKPFDTLKTSFTESEKLLKGIDFKTKIDELNEKVYKLRRASIIAELERLVVNGWVELDIKVFESFLELKKRIKVFDLNKSFELSATAKKQVKEQFDLVVNPIIEARERRKNTARTQ